ncbi:MAG: hydroxymethylglutaryl-CoA synthase [Methanobacteriota archaeon]|nr:MAG: hydroxymethylglutaryl-CoA synthase [Euryarchaeota archaeon]
MAVGISGYGVSIPRLRVKKEEYAKAWGAFRASGVKEKAVMGFDEDVLTFATKASRRALTSAGLDPGKVTRFALASTSAPYAEKLLSGTVTTSLGMPNDALVSDHTTSSRAGTEAMMVSIEHVLARPGSCAVCSVADSPRASMWAQVEHGFGAGAAAYVFSDNDLIAEFEGSASYASEHFGERFRPKDGGLVHDLNVRKFAQSSLIRTTTNAAAALMKKLSVGPEDYAYVAIQQPDVRTPGAIAKKLGFSDSQLAGAMVATELGDLGSASVPISLAASIDRAERGDRILAISYGSGAASDAMSFKVVGDRRSVPSVEADVARKEYIDYIQYLKLKGAIR